MNIFAEGIVKHAIAKALWVHNIKINPPLPLGSFLKMSRLKLDNGEQPTLELLERVRRETFCDWWHRKDCGFFVHVIAGPTILIPGNNNNDLIKRRKLSLHLVPQHLFHLVEQQNEYEWWQLTNEEKELLSQHKLVA